MSLFSELFGVGSGVKSIQRGTITAGTTATITSVNTAKSELRHLGQSGMNATSATSLANSFFRIELTNATTITASGGTGTISWELTEWN